MPANQDLVAADVQMMGKAGCETRLRDALQPVLEQFDIVLIDCPPALNMLTVNALVAADGVLIPMQCEYYALEGLTALVNTIEQIKAGPESGAGNRRHPAHHVRSAQQPLQRGFGAADRAFSATKCSAPSFRATCGWRKRRASASRRCITIKSRAARSPTWRSPAR